MTQWLDDAQQSAWRALITVVELLPGRLDAQLRRDADISHFEYFTLSILSEAPDRTLRMTELARRTDSTLPRLSHVVSRLETRGFIERSPCADDRRATNAVLTETGWQKVVDTAPGHAATVLESVFSELDENDVADLERVMGRILGRLERTD